MNHEQFIMKNVQVELAKLGFSSSVSAMASDRAIEHYRKGSSSAKKGKIFDECLRIAKAWSEKYSGQKANKIQ